MTRNEQLQARISRHSVECDPVTLRKRIDDQDELIANLMARVEALEKGKATKASRKYAQTQEGSAEVW